MKPGRGAAANILAGVTGGAVFLVFLFPLDLGIPVSVAVGAAGYIAGLLVFGPGKKPAALPGADPVTLEEGMAAGKRKLETLRSLSRKVKSERVGEKIDGITEAVNKILEDIALDPKDFPRARRFLGYYLDSTVKILERYVGLAGRELRNAELDGSLARVEASLDTIRKAFERQLAALLEDDMMDLDTELSLLERTIDSEGFGPAVTGKGEQE